MANLGSVLKTEIARVARRALKAELTALRKASAGHRRDLAALKRQVSALERTRKTLERRLGPKAPTGNEATADADGRRAIRFSAKGLKTLRARLGLSAGDFGRLAGVSGQSVYGWEQGKTTPRPRQLAALAALRGLGKREAAARLKALG